MGNSIFKELALAVVASVIASLIIQELQTEKTAVQNENKF